MIRPEEVAFLDATAQAELVQKKEVKPIELVEAATKRIERLNPELNAVVTPMFDLARDAADFIAGTILRVDGGYVVARSTVD